MNILVGMSGGVDSSVAALLLKKRGYAVSGITMAIWGDKPLVPVKKHACYGPDEKEDIEEARAVCSQLGIPHYLFDCSVQYEEAVVDYFREEYRAGRTPNPCVVCNQKIKFGVLVDSAHQAGLQYNYFATGHYARVERDEKSGRYLLKKACDTHKDQSYFLYRLTQDQLSRVIFPLGDLSKDEVRSIAKDHLLAVSEKEESQDFYSGDYRDLFGDAHPGELVAQDGRVLGLHSGIWNFTPGQRRGLGITAQHPLYVVAIDGKTNRIVVGGKEAVSRRIFFAENCNWIACEDLTEPKNVIVKMRSNHNGIPGVIEPQENGGVRVTLSVARAHIAPGQSVVFYDDATVVGGGVIQ